MGHNADYSSASAGQSAALSEVTIILTLFGRRLHTLRWLWHHNKVGFDCPILIGDGKPDPLIKRLLLERRLFPRLNYQYLEYQDRSYRDYFLKLADLAAKVSTPYAMLADNDDFIGIAGLRNSVGRLKAGNGFAAAGGRSCAFSLEAGGSFASLESVTGKTYTRFLLGSSSPFPFLMSDRASDRVLNALGSDVLNYYDLFNVETLRALSRTFCDLGIVHLRFHEAFRLLATLAEGRVYRDGAHVTLFRQQGTSSGAAASIRFVESILAPNWSSDYQTFKREIIRRLPVQGDAERADLEQTFDHRFAEKLSRRFRVSDRSGLWRWARQAIAASVVQTLTPVLPLRRVRLNREMNRILATLKVAGATIDDLKLLQREFDEIEATLTGPEFVEFLKANAPELLMQKAD